jgi:hypothetical protein
MLRKANCWTIGKLSNSVPEGNTSQIAAWYAARVRGRAAVLMPQVCTALPGRVQDSLTDAPGKAEEQPPGA